MVFIRLFLIVLLFSYALYANETTRQNPKVPKWVLEYFYKTTICSDPSPTVTPLLFKIQEYSLTEDSTPPNQKKLLEIIASYLKSAAVPRASDCHGDLYVALIVKKLSEIAMQDTQAKSDFREITNAVLKSDTTKPYEKVFWSMNLAEVEGFDSPNSKIILDEAFTVAKKIIEKSDDYENSIEFKKLFALKKWKPEEMDVLFKSEDNCSYYTEYSVKKNALKKETIDDIRAFANLIFNCDSPYEWINEKYTAPANDKVAKDDSIIKKNITELNKCVIETSQNPAGLPGSNSTASDDYKYRDNLRKEALNWLVKKYKIRVRTGGGGNC